MSYEGLTDAACALLTFHEKACQVFFKGHRGGQTIADEAVLFFKSRLLLIILLQNEAMIETNRLRVNVCVFWSLKVD